MHRHRAEYTLAGLLFAGLAACRGPATHGTALPTIITAAAWGSRPQPIPASRRQRPVRITVHHAGELWKASDEPYAKIRRLQAWGQKEKGWPDLPYHYLIAPDGRIFEGRPLAFQGETNTSYDTKGHALVQLWGNFEEQDLPALQLDAAVRLIAWLCREYRIDPATIAGHRDYAQTACPGEKLYRKLKDGSLIRRVRAALAR